MSPFFVEHILKAMINAARPKSGPATSTVMPQLSGTTNCKHITIFTLNIALPSGEKQRIFDVSPTARVVPFSEVPFLAPFNVIAEYSDAFCLSLSHNKIIALPALFSSQGLVFCDNFSNLFIYNPYFSSEYASFIF
jgi:hypothetical protein